MEQALTYQYFEFSFCKILYVDCMEITEQAGAHGELKITAVLDFGLEQTAFFEVPEQLVLYYLDGGEKKVLFSGVLQSSSMKRKGKYLYLQLTAKTLTYRMDIQREIRSFQNLSETNHQVMEEIFGDYSGCMCRNYAPEQAIGQFLFQYEETDWVFLKRLCNWYGVRLYPQAQKEGMAFYAGIAPLQSGGKLPELFYCCQLDFSDYEAVKANTGQEALPQERLHYMAHSFEIMPIGEKISYHGNEWNIVAAKRVLEKGLLRNYYTLAQPEAEVEERLRSRLLPGISLDGSVKAVQRNKVQVWMNRDTNPSSAGQYWFPYSTVAGSGDGSGWYCMPEVGEKIRVYFPTAEEREGYVISSLAGNTKENQSGSMDPAVKHISTAQGNTVTLSGGGAVVSACGGADTMVLGSDGAVSVIAASSISIAAGSKISFKANEIGVLGKSKVGIKADGGASAELTPGLADLKAVKINQN